MTDSIYFTYDKYIAFEKAYNKAVEERVNSFFFDGHEFLVSYAKYILEYLSNSYE